jgi:CBS domain containing-hemolysin-like protein
VAMLIFYAVLALGVSFLCSLLEASLLSLPRSQVESMIVAGSKTGQAMKALKDNIDRPLAAILTLNTIAHTVGAAGVGAQSAIVFGNAWVGLVSAIMTLAILILSEIIPKTIGAANAKSLAGMTAWTSNAMITLCYPIILGLEQINRLIGFEKHGERIGRMEVLATIRLGREGGSLADREHRTIMNLMALTRVKVSEILTPRTVLFALPAGSSVKEATATDEPLRFARIPIYDETIDDASNYVTRYDLLHAAGSGNGEARLSEFARPIHVLPEQATVSDALEQMLALHELIALIVDEHGGVEGIVTLEDVLETLLGEEIVDETDTIADMRELARQRTARRA